MALPTASDNPFPSVLLNETTAPSNPAASKRRLYVDANHVLRWLDSGGVDSPMVAVNKWNGTTAPTVNEDSGDGYAVGSRWIDTTNDKEYVCLDASSGAAVWTETTQAGGTGGVDSGTSNPGGPSTGDLFWRTDTTQLIYYDGTRWVTVQEFQLPLVTLDSVQGSGGWSASATAFLIPVVHNSQDIWLTRLTSVLRVPTTNDGTKFWTVQLRKRAPDNTATNVANHTTASDTHTTWTPHDTAIGAVVDASDHPVLDIQVLKTSTPGNLFGSFGLFGRWIVT